MGIVKLIFSGVLLAIAASCATVEKYTVRIENKLDGFYEAAENGREVSIAGSNRKTYRVAEKPALNLSDFEFVSIEKNASLSVDRYYIRIKFTKKGAEKFSAFTRANLNQKIYLVLGGEIVAAPMGMPDLHEDYRTFVKIIDFDRLFMKLEDKDTAAAD